MKILGIVLVVVGLVGLIYGGVTWTREEKVMEIGPIEMTKEKDERFPIPPVLGAVALVAGVVLLVKKGRLA
jgi:uncharacterized membrane protein YidH (DUF202 family)